MREILIIILILVYFIAGTPLWLAGTEMPYIIRALSYSFFHANIFHLAVNSLTICLLFKRKRKGLLTDLICAFIIAVIIYPLSLRPVIGFSNVLYAIIGLRTPPLSSNWWKTPQVLTFLIVTIAMAVIPSISATTHIAAFILGILLAYLRRLIKDLDNDIRRAGK